MARPVKIDEQVMDVLRDGTIDGTLFRLPDVKLERPLYVKVNDV